MFGRNVVVFAATLLYAGVRYLFFGPVPLEQLPSYVVNKAFAFSAAIALFIGAVHRLKGRDSLLQQWARASFGFAFAHTLLSFALWSREYYPRFFGAAKMNLTGEFILLFGAMAAWLYTIPIWSKVKNFRQITILAALFLALHAGAMGFANWVKPNEWPGDMPPISLLSVLAAAASIGMFVIGERKFVDLI
jgi:hypothetical protein